MKSTIICYSFVIITALLISSCKKENLQPPARSQGGSSNAPTKNSITVQAGNWKKGTGYNYYSCDLVNVVPAGTIPSCSVLYGNAVIPLSSQVKFLNGMLSAQFHNRDASLIFVYDASNSPLPFQSLTIKFDFH